MTNAPALVYPDAMQVVIGYLDALLTPPVRSRIPNPRPAELVTVTRTGGPEVMPMVDGAQLTVDCWAASQPEAWDIAQLARRLLHDMAGTVQGDVSVHRVIEVGGPQDFPDPVSDSPRVVFTLQVQLRGRAA